MDYLNSNNYILNIVPLFNVADSGGGFTVDTAQTASNLSNVEGMINTTTKSIAADSFTSFTSGSIVSMTGDFAVVGSFSVNGNSLGNVGDTSILSNTSVELVSDTNSLVLTGGTTSTVNAMTVNVASQPVFHIAGSGQVAIGDRPSTLSTLFDVYGDMYTQRLFVSSTVYCSQVITPSDERLKSDIRAMDGSALAKVCSLRGVEYMIGGRRSLGLLAQDVQRVVPSAVVDTGGTLGVDYAQLVPLLVEAIKELTTK